MTDAKSIEGALISFGKRCQAIFLAQRRHALSAPGQDFVRISLMTHIPDQPVFRRIKQIVKGDGQLDDAQSGTKVPARLPDRIQQVLPQLPGQFWQLGFVKCAKLFRIIDLIQKWSVRSCLWYLVKHVLVSLG